MEIQQLYQALRQVMVCTETLVSELRAMGATATVPPIEDKPTVGPGLTRAISCLTRVRFHANEAPNATFRHPGVVVIPFSEEAAVQALVDQCNAARDEFSRTIERFKADCNTERGLMLALATFHRDNNLPDDIPLIGSADRLKQRQLTRRLHFEPRVKRLKIASEEKRQLHQVKSHELAEQFFNDGRDDLAVMISNYGDTPLYRMYPSTQRWRGTIVNECGDIRKIVITTPVIVSPISPVDCVHIKGINDNGIEPVRKRGPRHDKIEPTLAIPELNLYVAK